MAEALLRNTEGPATPLKDVFYMKTCCGKTA